jgi:hypothetical protein
VTTYDRRVRAASPCGVVSRKGRGFFTAGTAAQEATEFGTPHLTHHVDPGHAHLCLAEGIPASGEGGVVEVCEGGGELAAPPYQSCGDTAGTERPHSDTPQREQV